MKKLPPLPSRRVAPNGQPNLQIVSNKIKTPQRFNSIQRVNRDNQQQYQQQKPQNSALNIQKRQNALMKRPYSARQTSASKAYLSNDSRGSCQSKESANSRGSSHRLRQSPHYNMKMRMSMPSISAHSWVLYQMREEKYICGRSNFKRRQIASLTKIMNLITILKMMEMYSLVPSKLRINVSREACTMIGTSAELKPAIQVSLEDLFYGMMLPSGNDAAHQVAQIGGALVHLHREGQFDKNVIYNCQRMSELVQNLNAVGLYIHQMNSTARKLGLTRSSWANPHGLSNVNNFSTAQDMAQLCMFAMKNAQFREIVSTKVYSCLYYYEQELEEGGSQILKGVLKWQNTNKMLLEGWSGIKTGITPNAGPCLSASCKRMLNGREYQFLVILLRSESMEVRWKQVRSLLEWIVNDPYYFI